MTGRTKQPEAKAATKAPMPRYLLASHLLYDHSLDRVPNTTLELVALHEKLYEEGLDRLPNTKPELVELHEKLHEEGR